GPCGPLGATPGHRSDTWGDDGIGGKDFRDLPRNDAAGRFGRLQSPNLRFCWRYLILARIGAMKIMNRRRLPPNRPKREGGARRPSRAVSRVPLPNRLVPCGSSGRFAPPFRLPPDVVHASALIQP